MLLTASMREELEPNSPISGDDIYESLIEQNQTL
jgi:hypothetical protein